MNVMKFSRVLISISNRSLKAQNFLTIYNFKPNITARCCTNVSYVQGQSPGKNLREYFYYIDHHGMLFLDDARMKNFTSCFKDKEFLVFFFKRLKVNDIGRYQESFPYLSPCGRERNFIRCDDVPIVYTHVAAGSNGEEIFCYNHAANLLFNKFEPDKLFMDPEGGRIYHPCHEKAGSIGLVQSKLAIEISKFFVFENGEENPPTRFKWKDKIYDLDHEWYYKHQKI